eukprot:scpid30845/ scgid29111/ 
MEKRQRLALHQDNRHRHGAVDPKAIRGTSASHNAWRYVRTRHAGTQLAPMHVPTRLTVWNSTATCSARIVLTNCADSNNGVIHVHCNVSQLSMEAGQPWASYLLSSGNYHGLRPSHSYSHTPAS